MKKLQDSLQTVIPKGKIYSIAVYKAIAKNLCVEVKDET